MLNVKSKLIQLAGPVGGYQFCRIITRSTPKILMYHRFSESPQPGFVHREVFERQVVYLKNNFNIITLNDLVKGYQQHGVFPANSVVITVDDGYSDFYDIAFSLLKKHNISATFFVTTRFIDGDFWLWPDRIRYILEHSNKIDLHKIDGSFWCKTQLMINGDRRALWVTLVNYLLSIPEEEKNHWLDEFTEQQRIKLPVRPTGNYQAVNWNQVREMDANNIEIGAHTQSHPSLGRLKPEQLSTEIQGSADVIHNQIGHRPTSFCFPNGQPSDYSELAKENVMVSGCQSAVTAFYDEHVTNDLFELRRFNVSADWQYFARSVNGVDVLAAKWLKTNNIMKSSM